MATNDINLQVINSMTQDKMNSLKNSDGKIPSLANQLIITDEEDANLSQFRTEPIYDMYSDDENLNKNRKTGIFSGTWSVFTIDAKYSGVRVYACLANKHTVFDCDLDLVKNGTVSEVTTTGIAKNQNTSGNNAYLLYGCNITISSSLVFTVREIFAYNGVTDAYSAYTSSDTTYFVYKVEGILKEPAMIYTGAELHADNGISIENGVISRATTKKQLTGGYYNCASGTIPISLSTILQYDFISVDVMGRSGGGGYLGTETKLIPVDTIIQNPSGNAGNNITYYNQRYALLGVIHLKFNTNGIVTLGIFASPYNNTNLEAVSNDNVFVGNVWGFKL